MAGREDRRHSIPASAEHSWRREPLLDNVSDNAHGRATRAAAAEVASALAVARYATIPAALLIVLAILNDPGILHGSPQSPNDQLWASSLLSLLLLLAGVQQVSVLLALEHRVSAPVGTADRAAQLRWVWLARLATVPTVGAAVWVAYGSLVGWRAAWVAGTLVELGVALVVWRIVAGSEDPPEKPDRPVPAPGESAIPTTRLEQRQLRAVGMSGGGIRAAAFALGGHQALQDSAPGLGIGSTGKEPHVFAVSGGSYIGAAMALRRAYRANGTRRGRATPWESTYGMGSTELERLRRNTQYLFEPQGRTRDGVVSLVTGAILNLLLVAMLLRLVAWLSAQLAVSTGFVAFGAPSDGDSYLARAEQWPAWQWVAVVVGVPGLCALGIVWTTIAAWRGTSAFDEINLGSVPDRESSPQGRAATRLERSGPARTILLAAALGWLVLVPGLATAAIGLTSLTTDNKPTATIASALHAVGFASDEACSVAFVDHVEEAAERADLLARLSPGAARSAPGGACGREVTVTRSAGSGAEALTAEERQAVEDVAGDLAEDQNWQWQLGGLGAVLAAVAVMLRRGPTTDAVVTERRTARLKRALLTWLPLVAMVVLAGYLLLRWTLGFLTGMGEGVLLLVVVLSVLAFVAAFLVDANATSLHSFYRSRLSSAFAVGVDDEEGQAGEHPSQRAGELPAQKVYRFSDLRQAQGRADLPRLHVVTTLNTRKPNQAPTMRGGFPMVLGCYGVDIYREEGRRVHVDARTYEDFAGPGRVSIMAAVATSGAAVSPLMGRYGTVMAPYRMLLTLFNLRVGAWVRNPLHAHGERDVPGEVQRERPRFLWMVRKPGLVQVALEAFGSSSADRRWVYLSDGGHLDNTGLVECVRHCVRRRQAGRILVLDASNDPVETWSAVGDAIGVVRADLNVELTRLWTGDMPPWMRRYRGSDLDVVVVKAVRTGSPAEARSEKNWWQLLPSNVQSFQRTHADFPRSSTTRQKFGDLEFEAYRGLGYASTRSALLAARWIPDPD